MATRPTLHRAVSKTKNTASNYNDNFDMMMDFVDDSITESKGYIANFMPSVTGQAGKFLSTDGTNASWTDIVNGQPYLEYINGLIITKDSSDTINISAGSCYDYTRKIVLKNGVQATKQNSTQTANTTYYVYIIGGINIDFLITTESSNPTLPSGFNTYRKIGSYITDNSANIDIIKSGDGAVPNAVTNVVKTYANGDNGYVVFSDGLKIQWGIQYTGGQGNYEITLLIPYSNTNYSVVSSTAYAQSRGDWNSTYGIYPTAVDKLTLLSRLSEYGTSVRWQTIGY